MALTAQSIIQRATETLQDSTSVRWPVGELARYFNDGQREVALYRPDAMVTTATFTCAAGSKQALPAGGSKLIDIPRNATTSKAVRLVNREILDAQQPGWHGITASTAVVHFTYDPRDPRVFYVYPPATSATSLDIVYSAYPTDINEPTSGTYTTVTGNLGVPDIYSNAVLDYILYRAYMKDSEYAGNTGRAQAHYTAFSNALGIEIKSTLTAAPSTVGNPNAAGT